MKSRKEVVENKWIFMKTVGIIGGLGPDTTAEFYLDLIFSCQKKDKNHRPSIIIASVPLPYAIEEDAISRNIGIDRCLPFLIAEARRLEQSGVHFIVMPCNSLHLFIEEIRKIAGFVGLICILIFI